MTYTAVASAGQQNGGTGNPGPVTITPHAVGNFFVLAVTVQQNGPTVTSLSATNITWQPLTAGVTGSTNACYQRTFLGVATSTSAASTTITFGGTGNPTAFSGVSYLEFSSTTGTPVLDNRATLDSVGTLNWPNITAAGSGELYWGYSQNVGAAASGTTSGWTYIANSDAASNGTAYNLSVGPGTVTGPTWGATDNGETFGEMVLLAPAGGGGPGPMIPSRPLRRDRRSRYRRQQWVEPPPGPVYLVAASNGVVGSLVTTVPVAAGDGMFLVYGQASGSFTTPSDGTANTWVTLPGSATSSGSFIAAATYAGSPGTPTVAVPAGTTITWGTSTGAAVLLGIRGIAPQGSDINPAATSGTSTSPAQTFPAQSQSGEIILAGINYASVNANTWSSPMLKAADNITSGNSVTAAWFIVPDGSSQSLAATLVSSSFWDLMSASFRMGAFVPTSVPLGAVITSLLPPRRVQRQPKMTVRTGMTPGLGLSGIPPMQMTRKQLVKLQVPPKMRVAPAVYTPPVVRIIVISVPRRGPPVARRGQLFAGMLPGKGLSGIPPKGPVTSLPPRRVQIQPRMLTRTGMTPGLGLSGIPPMRHTQLRTPVLRRQPALRLVPGTQVPPAWQTIRVQPSRLRRQPPQRLLASGFVPVTVQPTMIQQARLLTQSKRLQSAKPQRLLSSGFVTPAQTYPNMIFPARLTPAYPARLKRQPRMYVQTGMLPGKGLSGIPVKLVVQGYKLQRQQRMAVRSVAQAPPVRVAALRMAARLQRAPRQAVQTGFIPQPLRPARVLTVPKRLLVPPRQRLMVTPFVPVVVYPVVIQQARLRLPYPTRLQRQPRMLGWTGMLPGVLAPTRFPRYVVAPTSKWVVQAAPARWVTGTSSRWKIEAGGQRWVTSAVARWVVTLPFKSVSAASTEYVPVNVSVFLGSPPPNPTSDVVQMAFLPATQESGGPLVPPQATDWKTASWLAGAVQPYVALCLVGPGTGGVITLTPGNWNVWIKITDNPEVPAKFVDILPVY